MTVLTTAEGKRLSVTFSEIDEKGNIIRENERVNKVVVDQAALSNVKELEDFAQRIIDGE
ncbi:hypothetical protein [Phocaeicola sartorii]|uniref:hypothetical protein n=1 Tax=Phocaeicola sartorii TaxID=671267 RepID=UPI00272C2B30|nr:hypothetical protein [Phocaeicola sartorii]